MTDDAWVAGMEGGGEVDESKQNPNLIGRSCWFKLPPVICGPVRVDACPAVEMIDGNDEKIKESNL